jgi:uncharacterized lipoprotein YddW (UPF0748 family)
MDTQKEITVKKRIIAGGLALLIALLTLGGCAAEPEAEPVQDDSNIVGGRMTVDSSSSSARPSSSSRADAPAEAPDSQPEAESKASESQAQPSSAASTAQSGQPSSSAASGSTEDDAPPEEITDAPPEEEPVTEPVGSAVIDQVPKSTPANSSAPVSGEVRAVWISYLELGPLLKNAGRSQFTSSIEGMFTKIRDYGLNTVYVQARPFGDALYNSEYFPWSYLCTGTEGKDPGYDPLEIMVASAKAKGLRIEAWINPYRVRAKGNANALAASNPATTWLSQGVDHVISYDGVTSYNPASEAAQELIVNGVREIIRNYDVDGVHIDDYFYPYTDEAFDRVSYNRYRSAGGSLALADWRRSNVENLIKKIYRAVKEEDSSALFGVSPQSSLTNNYDAQYLDVAKIVSTDGYCDYVCPQVYFGFENGTQPFAETLDAWDHLIKASKIDLYVGLAAYKCGVADSWAGAGAAEWQQNKDLLSQMVQFSRTTAHYRGFAIYRYDSLFAPAAEVREHMKAESDSLKAIFY